MLRIENIILYTLFTTMLMAAFAAYFHFRRKETPGALFLSATSLSVTIWTIGYIIEFYARTLEMKFFGVQIQYTFGIPFTAALWLCAAIHLRTYGQRPNNKEFYLLMLVPFITMLLIWTNDFHHLVYEKMSLYKDEHFLLIEKEIGAWYYLNMAYSYTVLIIGSIILITSSTKAHSIYKGQLLLFLVIALLPWVANLIYVTGMNSYMRIDITPIAFTASLVLVEVASRRYGLFNLVPAAHNVVVKSINNGIIVIDKDYRIIEVNPYIENLLSNKFIVGQEITERLSEMGLSKNIFEEDEEIKEIEIDNFIFDVRISPITNKKGEVTGTVFTFYDVTERVKYQRELQELNASKDKLFSIIAHDLKNPFFGILGLSNIFCTEYDDLTDDEIKTYSKEINELAGSTYRILENLLDWSRQQTGKMEFLPVKFNLLEAVDLYIDVISPMAKLKDIKIVKEIPHNIFVFADSYMVSTVFRNIISNAIKFTDPGGEISITAEQQDNFVLISIRDNGVGMSETTLSGIFKIDEDVKSIGTMGERGTGLGLVLCKEFIEKNGGEISVESKINEGSIFHITIPLYV